jgi:hypothetical protein
MIARVKLSSGFAPLRRFWKSLKVLHKGFCMGQLIFWHAFEQYAVAWHPPQICVAALSHSLHRAFIGAILFFQPARVVDFRFGGVLVSRLKARVFVVPSQTLQSKCKSNDECERGDPLKSPSQYQKDIITQFTIIAPYHLTQPPAHSHTRL